MREKTTLKTVLTFQLSEDGKKKVCTQCKKSRSLDKFNVNKKKTSSQTRLAQCAWKNTSASTKGRGQGVKTVIEVEFASTKNGGQSAKIVAEVQYVYTNGVGQFAKTVAEVQYVYNKGRRRNIKTAKGVRSASTKGIGQFERLWRRFNMYTPKTEIRVQRMRP